MTVLPVPASAQGARPMRRDAARNHEVVLDAAREVLKEFGPDAGMEQIAGRAGVGIGTVYRHFPSKDALIEALVDSVNAELIALGDAALTREDGSGLEEFLRALGGTFREHRMYATILLARPRPNCAADRIRAQLAALTEQARAVGAVREDVAFGDVMVLLWALGGVVEVTGSVAPSAWQRMLDLHLGALRSSDVSSRRRPVSEAQLRRINRR